MIITEPAPAKLNLALHVRGLMPDGRHALETVFAFCTDGDLVEGEVADDVTLEVSGPFAGGLSGDNLVLTAAHALREAAGVTQGAALRLTKNLPVASGIGGGSADAAAALRLLTRLWGIDPAHAIAVAPGLGADVPACLRSRPMRGTGVGDELEPIKIDYIAGRKAPVLLINPLIPLSTRNVFANWDGIDRGPLLNWYEGRNDLEAAAQAIVPQIGEVRDWLVKRAGARFVRMSGSGATCFAFFGGEELLHKAGSSCHDERPDWWCLPTHMR